MRKCLRAQVLKLNGIEIIERGHTFKWSLEAMKNIIEEKLGKRDTSMITEIDL